MAADPALREGELTSEDGTRLFWRSWAPASPACTLAVVHGLGEHSGRYQRLGGAMAERGVSTYAVDLRGMGRSAGGRGRLRSWQRWVEDYAVFWRHVTELSSGEVVALGHSFGGVVALSSIIRKAVRPGRLVLSNPALEPAVKLPGWKSALGGFASRVMPDFAMSSRLDARLVSREPEVVKAYRGDPLVHDQVSSRLYTEWGDARREALDRAWEVDIPVMVILSSNDGLIDPQGGRQLVSRLRNVTLKEYEGRYHEPFNDLGSDEVFDDLAAWLRRPR